MKIQDLSYIITLTIVPIAASAGNLSEPIPVAQITSPVQTTDWSGSYIGLGFGSYAGDATASNNSGTFGTTSLDHGTGSQIFGGYLFQNGSFVYGGELALNPGASLSTAASPNSEADKIYDLKARLGYAVNNLLFYTVIGYSSAHLDYDRTQANTDFTVSGLNYGVGLDFAMSENFFIGAEYLTRNLDQSNVLNSGFDLDADVNSLSVRAAYRF